jgi:hypothetical protein
MRAKGQILGLPCHAMPCHADLCVRVSGAPAAPEPILLFHRRPSTNPISCSCPPIDSSPPPYSITPSPSLLSTLALASLSNNAATNESHGGDSLKYARAEAVAARQWRQVLVQ